MIETLQKEDPYSKGYSHGLENGSILDNPYIAVRSLVEKGDGDFWIEGLIDGWRDAGYIK